MYLSSSILENWFGRQRSLGLRKDNPSMVFGYINNAIRNQKHFKPIANASGMIALTDEPFPC